MIFRDPKLNEIFLTLVNNDNFTTYLKENGALLTVDDYYDMYGPFDPYPSVDKNVYVAKMNLRALKNVSKVLLENKELILQKTVTELANITKLTEKLKKAFGFKDVHLSEEFYKEIFYTYKYCYINSFFQNNSESFVPECDFEKMKENPAAMAYLDAVMKEFDKLNFIINNTYDFNSFKDIPFEYINYLTQLLGLEQKTVMAESSQEGQFRILAENVLEFYSKKGLNGTFELLFNLFGYSVVLNNYYFDRRNYYLENSENIELSTSDKYDYRFYLTERDPSWNWNDNISIGEIVTLQDFSPQENLNNFKELVEGSTLLCVLGYNTQYYDENGDEKTYEGPVYKYFKTNYLRIRPAKKYDRTNMTTNQLYQLKAMVDFLIPEFFMRDLYVTVDIESIDSKPYDKIAWGWMFTDKDGKADFLPWDNDKENNNFVMLDSEEWNQSYGDLYIVDYHDYVETLKDRDATAKVINDYSKRKTYYNSMGMDMHFTEDSWRNVFFNPVSEKIKYINSTQYWGDKVKTANTKSSDDLYEIWRRDLNYNDGITHKPAPVLKGTSTLSNLSLPKDYKYLPKNIRRKWTELQQVDLYGYVGNTLRRTISNMGNKFPIKNVGESVSSILNAEGIEYRVETVGNTSWIPVTVLNNGVEEELVLQESEISRYAKNHDNIINYDYVGKKLLYAEEFNSIVPSLDKDGNIYGYESKHRKSSTRKNITKIIRNLGYEGNCYIVKKDDGYHVMKNTYTRKNGDTSLNAFRFIPVTKSGKILYSEPDYKTLLDKIVGDNYFPDDDTEVPITTKLAINIEADNLPYKPFIITTDKNVFGGTEYNISHEAKEDVGTFFINDAFDNDETNYSEVPYEECYNARKPLLKTVRTNSFFKNDYIYSESDKKLYTIIMNGCCEILEDDGTPHWLGVEERNFRGKVAKEVVEDAENWYVYEYDEEYEGFSEKDDDDNYVFLNYDRDVGWEFVGFPRSNILRPVKTYMDNFMESGDTPRIIYLFNFLDKLFNDCFSYNELNTLTKILEKSISSFLYELYFTEYAPSVKVKKALEYLKTLEDATLYYREFDYNDSAAFYEYVDYLTKTYVMRSFDTTLVNEKIKKVGYDESFKDEILIGASAASFDKNYLRIYNNGGTAYAQAYMNGKVYKDIPVSQLPKSSLFSYYCYNKAYAGINRKGDTHIFYKFVNGFQVAADYVYEHFRSYLTELLMLYEIGKDNFKESLKTYFYREILSRYRTRRFEDSFFLSFDMDDVTMLHKYEKLNGVGMNIGEPTTLMPSRHVYNGNNRENIYVFSKSSYDGEYERFYIPWESFDGGLRKMLSQPENQNMIQEVFFPVQPTFYCKVALTDENKENFRTLLRTFSKEIFYDSEHEPLLSIETDEIDGIKYFVLCIKMEGVAEPMEMGGGHLTVRKLDQHMASNLVSNPIYSPSILRDRHGNAIEFSSLLDDREMSVTTYDFSTLKYMESQMQCFTTNLEYNDKKFWLNVTDLSKLYNADTIKQVMIKDEKQDTYLCFVEKVLTMEPTINVATSNFVDDNGIDGNALVVNAADGGEFVEPYAKFKDGLFEFRGEQGIFKDSYITKDPLHAEYEKWLIIKPDRYLMKMQMSSSKEVKIVAFTQNDCQHNDSILFCKKDN